MNIQLVIVLLLIAVSGNYLVRRAWLSWRGSGGCGKGCCGKNEPKKSQLIGIGMSRLDEKKE